jgi:hypothetical protein
MGQFPVDSSNGQIIQHILQADIANIHVYHEINHAENEKDADRTDTLVIDKNLNPSGFAAKCTEYNVEPSPKVVNLIEYTYTIYEEQGQPQRIEPYPGYDRFYTLGIPYLVLAKVVNNKTSVTSKTAGEAL